MELILTCGTSQSEALTDRDKARRLGFDANRSGYSRLASFFAPLHSRDDAGFEKEAIKPVEAAANGILRFLNENDPSQHIGQDTNPFGAELSTLYLYLGAGQRPVSGHTFHILRSDTYLGWFNALVLKAVIVGAGWGQVCSLYRVQNLCEKPPLQSDPLLNLSRCLKDILQAGEAVSPPVLIVSGGFKSAIPCLTVYSILFALPMVYLFEQSAQQQELSAVQEIKNRERNRKLWQEMADLKIAERVPWFQEALEFRNSRPPLPWL